MAARRWGFAAALTALVLSGQLVLQSTSAAMRATTSTSGSQWTADQLQPASNLSVTPAPAACDMALAWTITPSTWATGYKVYRTANLANGYSLVATVAGRATASYHDTDTTMKFGLRYYYVIRAYRDSWLSADSNSANALAPPGCV